MSKSSTSKSFFRSKPFIGALFCVWATGAISMVSLLSSRDCGDDAGNPPVSATSQPVVAAAPGWIVHHQLVAGDEISDKVATHLIARHPLPGIREDIRLLGSAPQVEARLAAAGWRVLHENTTARAQAMLSVTAPGGQVVWEGGFDSAELRRGNGAILDRLLIARIVTGQPLASRVVPYGCAVPDSSPL